MISKKLSRTITILVVILLVVAVLGGGIIAGYRYIIDQTGRFKAYDEAVRASEEAQLETTTEPGETPEAELTPVPSGTSSDSGSETGGTSNSNYKLVNKDTPGAVMVYIGLGDSPADIADRLEELGVIDNTTLFTLLSKFNGFDSLYRSGTHFVTRGMSYDEIMYTLTLSPEIVNVRFDENLTYAEFKQTLLDNDIIFDQEKMDSIVANPVQFRNYRFVDDLISLMNTDPAQNPALAERRWPLQGYLFPDTYSIDLNTTEEDIISMVLANTDIKLTDAYYERADEIGMTMDEVITLASIIQMESGQYNDMALVSRVFHNRLANNDLLQSDATVNYLRKQAGKDATFIVTNADMEMRSVYNTYVTPGLPPGPICSPSNNAIMAALYPDIDELDIYYFVANGEGTHEFAVTYEQHLANIDNVLIPYLESIGEGPDANAEGDGPEGTQVLEDTTTDSTAD